MTGRAVVSDIGERALFAPAPDVEPALPFVAPAGRAPVDQKSLPPPPPWRETLAKVRTAASSLSRASFADSLSSAVATEIDRGVAFLLMPVFLALGAMTYFALPLEPGFASLIGGVVFALVALIAVPFGRTPHFVLAAILLCFCGMLLAKAETWRAGTKMLGGEISTQVSGHVVALDHLANGRVRLTIDVTATDRPKLRYAPERIRASARKIPPGMEVGSHLKGLVRLMPPSGPVRPDSYDFSFESYFDRIGANGFFMREPELASPDAPARLKAKFSAWVQNSRILIADRIRGRISGAEGEIAAALVVGVRAGIPEDVNEALRRTGLYHIISISGLHMALVAGTIMGALRAVFALFPGFASRRPVKKYAASAALLAIAAYLFISGAQVAAQRSFIMLSVMLTALLFDRAALTMRNLAISAMVVIAVSPHEVIGPSFQMSFAATAALVGAYAWWSERSHAKPRPQARRSVPAAAIRKLAVIAAGLAMTSIVAGLATAAFGAYHFQRVSPLSLLANLAAMPVVSVFVMPFAVLGALAMPFDLDGPFFDVMGKGLTAMIAIANWFSARSPIDAVGLVSPRAVVLMTIALILATMMTTRLRLAALPFAILGILMLTSARTPD
ncbi:MAG: ComEC/Rec2 family competence protein, partial [Pseudaminobacter sp.]|nr:ComEC/Rec2 family competence protein [Pseudaminobacter sp.]